MCYHCRNGYTNARYISKTNPTKFVLKYPCGYCADCIRKKRSEWQLRAFYEAKQCFSSSKDAFVLFDTLTYKDDAIKYFHDVYQPAIRNCWDFECFSRDDVKKFFKKLRINLSRAGYLVEKNLRYLLTSEYGEKHGRPHYHLLLFSSIPNLSPLELSQFVSSSWSHGKTDGLPPFGDCQFCPVKDYCKGVCLYKSRNYVVSKRVLSQNNPNNLKLIRYVSKYISKDMYSYRKLFKRVFECFSIANPNWQYDYDKRLEFRRFKNQVLPFHLQSLGFGLCALEFEDKQYIDDHQAIRMPVSSAGVIASIPLSNYYLRHLYYTWRKIDNRVVWFPKDSYLVKKIERLDKQVENLRNRLFSWQNEIGLEKATLIAQYCLVFRGVLCRIEDVDLDYKEFYSSLLCRPSLGFMACNNQCFLNYNTCKDGYSLHKKRIFVDGYYMSHLDFKECPPPGYIVIDSKIDRFNGYDSILDLFELYLEDLAFKRDLKMIQDDKQKNRYYQLNLLEEY